jgi:hypothetical protein
MSEMFPAGKQGAKLRYRCRASLRKNFCKIKNMGRVLGAVAVGLRFLRIKPFGACCRAFHFVSGKG